MSVYVERHTQSYIFVAICMPFSLAVQGGVPKEVS